MTTEKEFLYLFIFCNEKEVEREIKVDFKKKSSDLNDISEFLFSNFSLKKYFPNCWK